MASKANAKLKEQLKRARASARNRVKLAKEKAKSKAKRAKDRAEKDAASMMETARRVAAPIAGVGGGLLGSVIRDRSEKMDALDEDQKRWVPRIVNYGVGDVLLQFAPWGSVRDLGIGMGAYQAGSDLDRMRLEDELAAGGVGVPGEVPAPAPAPAVGSADLDLAVRQLELGPGNALGVVKAGSLPARPLGVLEEGQVQLEALVSAPEGVWNQGLTPLGNLGDLEIRNR